MEQLLEQRIASLEHEMKEVKNGLLEERLKKAVDEVITPKFNELKGHLDTRFDEVINNAGLSSYEPTDN